MSILTARLNAHLSQRELAKMVGVTPSAICQWEKGMTAPRIYRLAKIAQICDCTIDELIGG